MMCFPFFLMQFFFFAAFGIFVPQERREYDIEEIHLRNESEIKNGLRFWEEDMKWEVHGYCFPLSAEVSTKEGNAFKNIM